MKKILSLLLLAAVLLGAVSTAGAEGVSGAFMGEGTGYGGTICVQVTLENGRLTDIEITSHNETQGIGTVAFERLVPDMIEEQSVALDSISGCTRASEGLKEAVANALAASGVEMDAFTAERAKEVSAETVTMQKDVVIVGAGAAGMTAGLYAMEGGLDVVVLEKMATVGGAGAISSGATNSYGSQFARDKGVEDSAEALRNDMLSAGHGYNQEELVELFIENSGETFDWLIKLGVEYDAPTPSEEHSVDRVFLATGSGVSITNAIEAETRRRGLDVMLQTRATSLVVQDGRVVGVIAEGSDGTTYEIRAKSVVLATGGYGANRDLLTDALAEVPYYGAACSTGDGQLMAQAIGAKLLHMDFGKVYPGGWEYEPGMAKISLGYTLLCVFDEGSIIVNSDGVRTFREGGFNYEFKEAIKADKNNILYLLLDAAAFEKWHATAVSGVRGNIGSEEFIDAAVEANGAQVPVIYHANTLEELAELAGMDPATLTGTVEKWNAAVEAGVDEEFGRFALARGYGEGPYYLIGERTRFATTLGGVQINGNFEVYDENDAVIPGLYAVGEVAFGVNGDDTIQGSPLTWAISSGRLLGKQLADEAE